MPSIVKSTGNSNFTLIPEGTHVARCCSVVNLGMQDSAWGAKPKHHIGFEVPSIRVEWIKDDVNHEGPAIISSRYTSSLHEKAILRQHLESWRGKKFTEKELDGFDLLKLLNVPCLISVVHTDDGKYANISAIMGLPPGTTVPDRETPLTGYDPSEPKAAEVLATLPEWQRNLIENQVVESEDPAPVETVTPDEFDDDIPF